jgi:hypothetical protein
MWMRRARRSLQFEPLERRVTMSAALTHAAVVPAAAHLVPIKGTFTGGSTSFVSAPDIISIGGLSGNLGVVPLNGSVGGQISGHRFVSGFIQLSNPQGTLVADLGRGTLKCSGKTEQLKLLAIVTQGTGSYSDVAGTVGTARFQLTPATPKSATKTNHALRLWYPKIVQFTLLLGQVTLKADQALLQP